MATIAVVPDPMNGSRIISPFWLPANMQGSIKSGGNTAKWLPLYGLFVTDQTDRLFFVGYDYVSPECGCNPVPSLWYFPFVRSLVPQSFAGSLIASLS